MSPVDVAIACCRSSGTADPTDLYPDPDAAPLQQALKDFGASSVLVSWDDPRVEWSSFSQVVISSTWDSVDRPTEYLAWASTVSAASALVNPAPMIEWNIDKTYLRALSDAGVPTIPTIWVEPHQSWEPPGNEFVIKPSISAGGRSTARYASRDSERALSHVQTLHEANQTALLQPYMTSIDRDGELDLVFFDGHYSHAVHKKPALRLGEGVVERPWERMAWTGTAMPTNDQFSVAVETLSIVSEILGEVATYGRVDLITDSAAKPLVLEVELIDPYLSLDVAPTAASGLARCLLRSRTTQ